MSAAMERSGKFLPFSEYRRISAGSLENRLERMAEVVSGGVSKFIGDASYQVISTFDDGAIILSEDLFHRVQTAASDDGELYVTGISPVDLRTYAASEKDRYLTQEAHSILDTWLFGSAEAALLQMENLASMVDSAPRASADRQIQVVETVLGVSRLWKKVFTEQRTQFEKLRVSGAQLEPRKYEGLYSNGAVENVSAYAEMVKKDLGFALARIESLVVNVEKGVDRLQSAGDAIENASQAGEFALDLLEDLRSIKEHSTRAAESVCLIECLGKLRDVVVDALPDYQLAAAFVEKVSGRLAEIQ